jgi:hypothetical protein
MRIETRKLNLINWISRLNNEEMISKIEHLQDNEKDWWDLIDEQEKSEIEQGLAEIERGETKTHQEVMAKYAKWL